VAHVHPSAIVDPRAKLGEDVRVGPYAVVGEEVELAPGVEVGAHTVLCGRTTVGSGTRIHPSCVIGGEPQVRGTAGSSTALVIGEANVIREFAVIHAGSEGGVGRTRIGDANYLMNHVHVAHDCQIGSHCVLASYTALAGHVRVGDHAVTGAFTGVHQHTRIGESAFTAANSMVSKDVPPFARAAGDRARLVGLNSLGLSRRGLPPETIAALRHAFHVLFQSRLRLDPALERARRECGEVPEVGRLLRFLGESERGFVRW
jgi:UDP-N-acetylglucosamine acyltransferase